MNRDAPLQYDPSGLIDQPGGVTQDDLTAQHGKLESARREILEIDIPLFESGEAVPTSKDPLDSGFIRLPERLLADHDRDGVNSELGQIIETSERLASLGDRVIVLGIGGSYMGARALMEACRNPYYNELDRSERHRRPRLYFAGYNVDNDATHALLDLVQRGNDDWTIVVISKSGGTLETAVAFRQFLAAMKRRYGGSSAAIAERVVPVTGNAGKLSDLADSLGCIDRFPVPDGVGGRFSVFSAVGLLPAALLGLDVKSLLRGAADMNHRFATSPIGHNPVLDYAGVGQAFDQQGRNLRVLSVWSSALESAGLWYDQLFAESLGKQEKGSTPFTVVNTRDLHSRAQQHQEGSRDKLITNVIVENWRNAPLPVGKIGSDHDQLDQIATKTLPDIMTAAIRGTNEAYRSDRRPTADIRLPQVSEFQMGELLQMLMLETVVEGRMMGINPYGQPGVEAYKVLMKRELAFQ